MNRALRISEFVDYHLKPLVRTLPSYIKDTTHFLLQLQNLGPLTENAIPRLVTLIVSSLYTNILHKEGEEACRHFLNIRPLKSIPTERICDLIRMILGMNNFSFNGQHFLQTRGTAMGTHMAPSYAFLVHGKFRTACHRKCPSETICLMEIYRWHFHDLDWRRR